MELLYGQKKITLKLPPGVLPVVLQARGETPLSNPEIGLLRALRRPIASKPLQDLVSAGESVCILVNDSSRVARSELFLPLLIDELTRAGIREKDIFIVFANGSHRALNHSEMQNLVGERVASTILRSSRKN